MFFKTLISWPKNYLFFFLFYIPIFFINNLWDGSIISYGFSIKDLSGIKNWYIESSSNFQYYVIKFLFFIKEATYLSNELIFDTFTLLILFFFSKEIKNYFIRVFTLEKNLSNILFILVITFPTWNFITEINLGLYLFCFYLAILGYNIFTSRALAKKLIGILIIFFSFSIKSNFAFVFSLCFLEFFYNYKKKNLSNLIIIFLVCLLSFLIYSYNFQPYGQYKNYNEININDLKIINLKIILDYLSFILYYLTLPIFLILFYKIKPYKNLIFFLKKDVIYKYLLLIIFFSICLSPYYLVDKSTDLFNFTDFESRHVFSIAVSIPFILIFTIKILSQFYSKKLINYLVIFLFLQNIIILSLAFLSKYNSSVVRNNLIKNFKYLDEPKRGLVLILIGERVYQTNFNFIFFESFKASKWFTKKVKLSEFKESNLNFDFEDAKKILNNYEYKIKYGSKDYEYNCTTVFKILNDPSNYSLIKEFYLFDQKEYFKVQKVSEHC